MRITTTCSTGRSSAGRSLEEAGSFPSRVRCSGAGPSILCKAPSPPRERPGAHGRAEGVGPGRASPDDRASTEQHTRYNFRADAAAPAVPPDAPARQRAASLGPLRLERDLRTGPRIAVG
jgi:hypothetical protein